MARTDSPYLHNCGPDLPSMGTLPSSANTLYPEGTIVTRSNAGRAVSPSTADASGYPALGVAKATFLNRTGDEMGGLDDSGLIEVDYGVKGFPFVGAEPLPGDPVYVVDNWTVSSDRGANRGLAGFCSEVRDSRVYFQMGPHVVAAAAGSAGDPGTAMAINVPIPASPAWVDNTTNGLDPALGVFGFNPTIDNQPFKVVVSLPDGLDGNTDLIVRARMSISSIATDNDVTAVLVAKVDGAADAAPANAQILAVAAADFDFVIDAADVPAGANSLYLELDCAGTLDTHDAYLHSLSVFARRD